MTIFVQYNATNFVLYLAVLFLEVSSTCSIANSLAFLLCNLQVTLYEALIYTQYSTEIGLKLNCLLSATSTPQHEQTIRLLKSGGLNCKRF